MGVLECDSYRAEIDPCVDGDEGVTHVWNEHFASELFPDLIDRRIVEFFSGLRSHNLIVYLDNPSCPYS
jgi:hypothetical protein